ncbi:MAG TPA: cyclic nucleotide-binding protein [Gallionella sp.]|jgi:CRP-like cAMP-binding protein|nr:cyclic nucleotide-binding domain-containing protein [Gallionella sp.]OGS67919.1 MAG: cyclic nucleotide-binding protein [Gallionellales bacterium GWA2_54_124]OGT20809.1 MAG: cyclic nucleotide-binding protein [Gallionellales bacterium RIFOXYD12_FULL_53_10]HCI52994.1 cyclic nucleotide-binding protein [Gallionella sp.]
MAQNNSELDRICDMLLDSTMFRHMKAPEIIGAAPYFGIHNYSKGETIFNEGDQGTFMCFVQQGIVSVVKVDKKGEAVEMGREGPGHSFGEMAVFDGERRSASCVAATDCELLTLAKTAMDDMLKDKPRIGAEILRAIATSLSRRMRASAGRLVDHLAESEE